MPAYNAEAHIVEALKSILAQGYAPLEVIVVDDGSSDSTFELANSLDTRIRVLQRPHSGISSSLNEGIRAAQGEWLAFLDADDLWTPDALALRFDALRSGDSPNHVFGLVQNFYSPETDEYFRARVICPPEPLNGITHGTLLQRRTDFLRVGLFNEQWQLGGFMQWVIRASALGLRYSVVPHVVLKRRLHYHNTGLTEPGSRQDYARVLKAILAQRRAAQQP
jgi:glycosyltransferase involved in cell wall biosynthesis